MSRTTIILAACLATLPVLGAAAWFWRRHYRDDGNQARRIVKNSTLPLILRLVVRGLDLVVAVVLLGAFAPGQLGAYDLAALFVVQYLGTISDFGLGLLLTREVARDSAAASRLFAATLTLRLVLTLACVPAAALLIGGYGLLGLLNLGEPLSSLGQQAIWVLLLTLVPSAYAGTVTALFHANERMEVPALIELVTAIISTIARVSVVLLGLGVMELAWAAVLTSCLTALIFDQLQRRSFFPPRLAWDTALLRRLAVASLPLMLNSLLVAVFFRFDTFLIRAFAPGAGDEQVALYTMPYRVIGIAMILPPIIVGAVFPLLARQAGDDRTGLVRAQRVTLQALLMLAIPLAMGMTVLATELVAFFTRGNAPLYLPVSPLVLAVTAWFLPLSFVNGLNQYVLIALDRQQVITPAFGLSAVVNFGLNLLAIPLFGLLGASVVTILTEVVLYSFFWRTLRHEGLTPPLLPLCWRPAVAAFGMGAALLPLSRMDLSAGLTLLLSMLLAPLLYLALLWALGAFGVEERAMMQRVLGRAHINA